MPDRTPSYDDVDRSALERSMEIAQRDSLRADQLAAMLRDDAWHSVAKFASYCCQKRALGLKPWEDPPLCAAPGTPGARPLDRMLANNISQYEPDPLSALALASPPAPIKAPTATTATRRKGKKRSRKSGKGW